MLYVAVQAEAEERRFIDYTDGGSDILHYLESWKRGGYFRAGFFTREEDAREALFGAYLLDGKPYPTRGNAYLVAVRGLWAEEIITVPRGTDIMDTVLKYADKNHVERFRVSNRKSGAKAFMTAYNSRRKGATV